MNDAQLLQLLSLCRNELQITWEDNDTDDRIKNHIQNGITYLCRYRLQRRGQGERPASCVCTASNQRRHIDI